MKSILRNIMICALLYTCGIYAEDKMVRMSPAIQETPMIMHPAMINIKLIALEAKTWWVAEKIKVKAQDTDQKMLIEQVQQNAITMKRMLMEDLKKRLCESEEPAE